MGFLPIATWIGQLPTIKPLHSDSKVFIICTDSVVGDLIASHYSAAYETRWTRLQKTPLWMFADLLHIFGDWNQVWNTTKSNLVQYRHQIHEVTRTTPLLQLTRALHDEAAKILSVSEQLRVHSSAVARFLRLREVNEDHGLAERAQEHFEDIQYHEETSQVILRQLENMTSLVLDNRVYDSILGYC
ncbi:hypothetical protein N7478_006748 [Penicillium angulare]|uniref:uncharacterized protein n=1 Tax=Penicillium angulare TaxID=116970 RepID=UPI00253F9345|nr:uncharacterized protein N7478_006748 [Penicillium angulare]KAJ5281376.1 hypothetical protein N7478_006748 [Penicillium angulare]